MIIAIVIIAQSTTAFALEYTSTMDNGQQILAYVSLNVPKDITQKSNLVPDMIEALFPQDLKGLGQAFYEGEQQYNINALFVLAIVRLESGNGTSSLARNHNNLGGIKSGEDGYRSFATKEECVKYMFDLLSRKYVSQGRTTIGTIGQIYCTTDEWVPQVTEIMNDLIMTCNDT
jgi:hypothetical protein